MLLIPEIVDRLDGAPIAVMLGGTSVEREVSLRSGANVLAALERHGLSASDIDPQRAGWVRELESLRCGVVFLALHGRDGEDGRMQGFLETIRLRYTGSGVLASAVAMHKVRTKQILVNAGLPTPGHVLIPPHGDLSPAVNTIPSGICLPVVVKPTSEGSSVGVSIVHSVHDLLPVLQRTRTQFPSLFVEQFIKGVEVTVGIVGVGRDARALPVLELVPHNEFYDYEAKYTEGMTTFHVPARLSDDITRHVQDVGLRAHHAIGCHGFSRVDMMVTADGQAYITELNTLPGLTNLSDLPAQAIAAGISYDELIIEILSSAFVERME